MPPRAKRIVKPKKKAKSSALTALAIPENIPVIVECAPATCTHRVFHFEHLFALSAAFIFVFSVLFSVSTASRAQEFRAPVSATVLPLEMYTNYRLKEENFWEKFWKTLDPYQKLMIQSGAGLAAVVIPLGAVLWFRQRRVHRGLATTTPPPTPSA